MELSELHSELEKLEMPVAYNHFDEKTKLPFILYLCRKSKNIFADNVVYRKYTTVEIELYTLKKDLVKENQVEDLLNKNEIPFQITSEMFLENEKMYRVVYEIFI